MGSLLRRMGLLRLSGCRLRNRRRGIRVCFVRRRLCFLVFLCLLSEGRLLFCRLLLQSRSMLSVSILLFRSRDRRVPCVCRSFLIGFESVMKRGWC